MNFEEGEEYELKDFPFKLESLGGKKMECRSGDEIITFEYSKIRCTDITRIYEGK